MTVRPRAAFRDQGRGGNLDDLTRSIPDGLSRLAERNLLRREDVDAEPRFGTLDTVTDFAFESLIGGVELIFYVASATALSPLA